MLAEAAWPALDAADGGPVQVGRLPLPESMALVRRHIYGKRRGGQALAAIIRDVADGQYIDVDDLSAFLSASATLPLDADETVAPTRTMGEAGTRLSRSAPIMVDEHCGGGLSGKRTRPIVVAIAAANALVMSKTSSPAITAPRPAPPTRWRRWLRSTRTCWPRCAARWTTPCGTARWSAAAEAGAAIIVAT